MEEKEMNERRDIQYNTERDEQEISISQLLGIVKQRRVWIYLFFIYAGDARRRAHRPLRP